MLSLQTLYGLEIRMGSITKTFWNRKLQLVSASGGYLCDRTHQWNLRHGCMNWVCPLCYGLRHTTFSRNHHGSWWLWQQRCFLTTLWKLAEALLMLWGRSLYWGSFHTGFSNAYRKQSSSGDHTRVKKARGGWRRKRWSLLILFPLKFKSSDFDAEMHIS